LGLAVWASTILFTSDRVGGSTMPLAAQTVHGRLLEQGTGWLIEGGVVTLMGEAGEMVAQAESDSAGGFTLRAPDPGSFFVRAERVGYRTKTDGVLELAEGGEITIDFYLLPKPFMLEGLEATGERESPEALRDREYLVSQGFYDRMKMGFGQFITPEDMEEKVMFDAWDLFRSVPFVDVSVPPRPTVGVCRAYVDGMLVHHDGQGRWRMEDDVSIEDIVAVEIYGRSVQVPPQYQALSCGRVALVWTRRW